MHSRYLIGGLSCITVILGRMSVDRKEGTYSWTGAIAERTDLILTHTEVGERNINWDTSEYDTGNSDA